MASWPEAAEISNTVLLRLKCIYHITCRIVGTFSTQDLRDGVYQGHFQVSLPKWSSQGLFTDIALNTFLLRHHFYLGHYYLIFLIPQPCSSRAWYVKPQAEALCTCTCPSCFLIRIPYLHTLCAKYSGSYLGMEIEAGFGQARNDRYSVFSNHLGSLHYFTELECQNRVLTFLPNQGADQFNGFGLRDFFLERLHISVSVSFYSINLNLSVVTVQCSLYTQWCYRVEIHFVKDIKVSVWWVL